MATKVLMPQLGESVTEGTISRWIKNVGDKVEKYETLCEVETDKVNAEVPSSFSGTITEILTEEGTTVSVGTPICYIQQEGEAAETEKTHEENSKEKQAQPINSGIEDNSMRSRYSPAVLRLAQEHNLDLSKINGTGLGGRITRKDVLDVIENGMTEKELITESIQESMVSKPEGEPELDQLSTKTVPNNLPENKEVYTQSSGNNYTVQQGDQIIPASNVRKTIAQRMVQSKHEAPHAWTMIEADVTNLVEYRNKIKDDFKQKEGFSITFLPFFIKAAVEAIKEYPMINSMWDGDRIIVKKDINISIAVATDEALYVPVIKDADQKSIYGLAKSINELAKKTKEGKLSMADTQGGTFTVNNTGSFGSVLSAPIINHPQAAIITLESIMKKPVVINDMIAVRSMVNLCVSLDHRVLDGLVVGRYLQSVKQKLENMSKDTVNIY